jgi:excisionase family DNA binding protein
MANQELETLTTEETARILRVNIDTIRRLLRARKLPGVRIGKHWRIRRQDLDDLLKSGQLDQR